MTRPAWKLDLSSIVVTLNTSQSGPFQTIWPHWVAVKDLFPTTGQSVKPNSSNHNCRCHVRSEFRSLLKDPIWNKSHPTQWKGCVNLTSPWSSDRPDRGFQDEDWNGNVQAPGSWKQVSRKALVIVTTETVIPTQSQRTDLQMFSNIYGAHNLLQVTQKLRLAKTMTCQLLQEVYPRNHLTSSLFLLFKWILWCPLILTEENILDHEKLSSTFYKS